MIEAALGRLGAIKGGLLSSPLFQRMINAATPQEAVSALANTTYNNTSENFTNSSTIELEHYLRDDALVPWKKITKFLEGSPLACATLMVAPLEIENIRTAVRALSYGQDVPRAQIFSIGQSANFDSQKLLDMRELPQVEALLKGTPYEDVYGNAIERLVNKESPFAFEQALSVGVRSKLLKLASAVERSAVEYLEERILFTNVRWIIWLKFIRSMQAGELHNHLVALPSKRSKSIMEMFIESKSSKEAADLLKEKFEIDAKSSSPNKLIHSIKAAQDVYSRKQLKIRFMTFASILAYYDVVDTECRNIVTILTGLRQGRSVDFISKRIAVA